MDMNGEIKMNNFMNAMDTLMGWIGSYQLPKNEYDWARSKWAPASEFGAPKPKRKYKRKKK
jgi:hypothetical protein